MSAIQRDHDKRIAGVRLETEELRAANLALEAQIAPRRLSREQAQALGTEMARFASRVVAVESYALDAEGATLAGQIVDALRPSGVRISNKVASTAALGSIALGIHVSGSDRELTHTLRTALSAAELVVALEQETIDPKRGPSMRTGVANEPTANATVLVSVKPIETAK